MARKRRTTSYLDEIQLKSSQRLYERAAKEHARYKDTKNGYLYEAAERRAFANLMIATARYGRGGV